MRIVPPNARHAAARCNAPVRRLPPLWLLSLGLAAASAQAQEAAGPVVETRPAAEATVEAPAGAAPVAAPAAADAVVAAPAPEVPAAATPPATPVVDTQPAPAADPAPAPVPPAAAAPVAAPPTVVESAVPAVAPAPPALAIVPLPPEQATERALGARCPVDLAGRLASQGDLLIGACQGTMPAHLAAMLVALPEQDIHLPRSWREREVRQKAWFKAVPGYGQRPDFIVRMGDIWVRSLEGRDADSTFYLVSAPFTCSDQVANRDEYGAEPVRVPAGDCREAYVGQRVYQVRGDAAPRDVTADAMPVMPQQTEADRARQLSREGRISLDHSKLQYGPAMRWFVQYPESAQKGGPRVYSDWNREHIAFVVWTGDRFELRDKVARAQWPCDPVAPGDRACGGFPDSGPDLFVTAGASVPMAASSP
ncbi:hypothetical protein ACT6SE_12560 [Stenotrophomonas sp. LC732]|uniref:hypothetical protein n=1 Tax=Stenotrophomonas TaxID=40323 RepID=UPI000A8BCC5B|nr:hypothetical protein PLCFDHLH_03476 [Stenotrophomonas maltophilia]QNG89786.1 hypothetical protein IMCGPPIG_00987 [Stenotrophomonas maltophilia]